MRVSGVLPLAEAQKAGVRVRRIVFGASRFVSLIAIALWVLCVWAILAALDLGLPPVLAAVTGIVAFLVIIFGTRRVCTIWSRRTLRNRGAADSYAMTFEIAPEGLAVKSELSKSVHYSSAFEELVEDGDYWLFLLLGTAVVLPKRFFATPEAERAFITAVWSHLDDKAKARSSRTARYIAEAV